MTAEGREWIWRDRLAADAVLRLDLVRAVIVIEPSTGDEIEVVATAPDNPGATRARLVTLVHGADIRILDVFPTPSPLAPATECLPPLDEHGDLWNHVVRFVVTVRAPPGQRILATVRDGAVRDVRPALSLVDAPATPALPAGGPI